MINIKQPPGIDLIGQRELYNYLSELATELNREFLTIEERLGAIDGTESKTAKIIKNNTDAIAALDERVTALENE